MIVAVAVPVQRAVAGTPVVADGFDDVDFHAVGSGTVNTADVAAHHPEGAPCARSIGELDRCLVVAVACRKASVGTDSTGLDPSSIRIPFCAEDEVSFTVKK